jgi:putative nucleotidyltransferase with HDIG domain
VRMAAVSDELAGARVARDVRASRSELLLRKGERLTAAIVRHLERRGVRYVYVDDDFLPDIAPDADVDESTREVLSASLHRAMDSVGEGGELDVAAVAGAAARLAAELGTSPPALFSLSRLRAVDEATVQHSVNVAVLAMLAADHYALDAQARTLLGLGALLHDVGKALVPVAILRKPGPLDVGEWQEMRRHPELGHRLILERGGDLDPRVALVALRHHERLDGKGYPAALRDEEIDLFARLAMVADVWDAMVSPRWYKPSFPFAYVARHMRDSPGLDREAVEALLARVALFPTGSFVRLTSGAVAWVVGQDLRRPERPLVLILTDPRGEALIPYVAELAGGGTHVEAILPDLPADLREHCRRHMGPIARALEQVRVETPAQELTRRRSAGADPSPTDGARPRHGDGEPLH